MILFMTELPVENLSTSLVWYRDRLRLKVELQDNTNRFALLRGTSGAKLALKEQPTGTTPGPKRTAPDLGLRIHFQVVDLEAELERLRQSGVTPNGPVKTSSEGYQRAIIIDPNGHRIVLFQWVVPSEPDPIETP